MLSAVVRHSTVLATVLTLGLVAPGCAVREQTQWSSDRQDGVSAEAGEISIDGTVVVADDEGAQATVLANLANDGGEDELLQVRVGSVETEPENGPLTIPANGYAKLGPDGTPVDVEDIGTVPGMLIEVEFIFATAPRATLDAFVKADEGIYAGFLD